MPPADARDLFAALEQVSDPRGCQGQRHPFMAMLAGVVCATLCGARGLKPIAQWLCAQEPATWHWLGFKRRPPCANCFADLLKVTSPEDFERAVREWTDQLECVRVDDDSLSAVSIDGKSLCGTLQAHQRAIHLLSASDHQSGCVLSQTQVNPETNEAKAAIQLLKTLILKGRVVLGDAMFSQKEFCREIIDSGDDYFIVVKDNQPTLRRDVQLTFAKPEAFSPSQQREMEAEVAYGITSVGRDRANAEKLLCWNRGHWGIENKEHWVRDETFVEDRSRVRSGAAPQVLAAVRNLVINWLRAHKIDNLAAALRENAWNPQPLFATLGKPKQ